MCWFHICKKKIDRWYNGRVYGSKPGEDFPFIGRVYSPSAIRVRKAIRYSKDHYQFLIATSLAIIGVLLSL